MMMKMNNITLILDDSLVDMEMLKRQLTKESSFMTEYSTPKENTHETKDYPQS